MASKAKPLMAPVLVNLLSTISKYWHCKCASSHQAALLLFTHRTPPKFDSLASFTFLFRRSPALAPVSTWQETEITVSDKVPKSAVRITLGCARTEESRHVHDLCTITKGSNARVNLKVDGSALLRQADTTLTLDFGSCEPVTFTSGYLENSAELGYPGKICLAVVLSYAFLDFCGQPWFPGGWKKDTLYLMQRGESLHLQPFLVTDMRTRRRETKTTKSVPDMRNMKLLHHAILLMEVFEQDLIRITTREEAQKRFDSIEWGVYERFSHVVQACLKGDLMDHSNAPVQPSTHGPPSSVEISDQEFASVFCARVLAPLEADLASQWKDSDPDRVISTLKLPGIRERPSTPNPSNFANTTKVGLARRPKPSYLSPSALRRVNQTVSTMIPINTKQSDLRFFDTVEQVDSSQAQKAARWFHNFEEATIQDRLPKRPSAREQRIKIAILDTGINMRNTWISQKKGRIKCWPSEAACEDVDGHGTHVAHLLLRLAPHTQIFVSKVNESRLLKDADIKQIAEAIIRFSTGSDRVDIINISFGFPKYIPALNPILSAINVACNNGFLIFAAAGNEGGNQGVFWPTALHEVGFVIRVNSSDSDGGPSGFNPDTDDGRRICTLGEGAPSCQPDPKDPLRMIHRSGTSFATPIAAAIAAIVLGFMDNADLSSFTGGDDLLPRLRTVVGMEKVLCQTCVYRESAKRSGFSYITPWHFLSVEEQIRLPRILGILSEIPVSPLLYKAKTT